MNDHHSPSFATVFFLVTLFIGMGVLGYHAVVVSVENGHLNETVGTLQADMATQKLEMDGLKIQNTALTSKNIELLTENTAIAVENSELKTALVNAETENSVLRKSDPELFRELETLRREISVLRSENQQLKAQQGSGGTNRLASYKALQSTFLPSDLDFWMQVAVIVFFAIALSAGYIIYNTSSKTRSGRSRLS